MGIAKKTKRNPFGLTTKQTLVIEDVKHKLARGEKPTLRASVEKIYDVKDRRSATAVVAKNMKSPNFREALIDSLVEKKILGADSLTEKVMLEGLKAETKDGDVDYDSRLKYVQEIHKVAGVYAPMKTQSMNLNLDMTEEELDKKIKELQEQLK